MGYHRFAILLILALSLGIGVYAASNSCFPQAAATYLRLSVDENPGASATLQAYVYALNTTTPQRQATPVSRGLVFVSWGDGKVCRLSTDADGKASATFSQKGSNYPNGGDSLTYTATFCPFAANHSDWVADNPEWMANCARLKDAGGAAITRLDYTTIAACPGASADDSAPDLSAQFQPSTAFLTVRNSSASTQSVTFCWGLAAIFGLLFSAMFVSGRNPLYFLDFSATRNVRQNRYAGNYMAMTQNVSVAPGAILSAVDRGANMAMSSSETSESQSDVDSAESDEKTANADNEKVQANPAATQEQKDASANKAKAAKKTTAAAENKLTAAKNLTEARTELKTAQASGDKTKIAAAQTKVDDAQSTYRSATKNYSDASGQSRSAQVGLDNRMQTASQQGFASGFLNRQVSTGLAKINPLKGANLIQPNTDENDKSFWAKAGNSAIDNVSEGLIKGVALSVPGMAMGKGKFGMKRVGNAMGHSMTQQARAVVKQEAMDFANRGTDALAPMLVHGVSTPDSPEWKAAESELGTAQGERQAKAANVVPYADATQYETARNEYGAADAKYQQAAGKMGTVAEPYNAALNQARTVTAGITRDLLNTTFDLLADKWTGAEQAPRLGALRGFGGAMGLTVSEFLSQPVKYAQGYDANEAQKLLQQQDIIYRQQLMRQQQRQ